MTDRELMQMALDALEVVAARMLDCRDELAERGGRPQTNLKHRDLWDLAFLAYTETAIPIAGYLRARLAQPEPEPVAWMHDSHVGFNVPLYTAPPQRKPLLASDIVTMYEENPRCDADMVEFARAIEAAHSIKGDA